MKLGGRQGTQRCVWLLPGCRSSCADVGWRPAVFPGPGALCALTYPVRQSPGALHLSGCAVSWTRRGNRSKERGRSRRAAVGWFVLLCRARPGCLTTAATAVISILFTNTTLIPFCSHNNMQNFPTCNVFPDLAQTYHTHLSASSSPLPQP